MRRWTVSELTRYIREMFEMDSHLKQVEVTGEVSNLRVPGSGHAYFTLKDSDAALRCVMWASTRRQPGVYDFKNGEMVIARGSMSVYERDGQYQLYCRSVKPAGLGDLFARFEELKARLDAEGLFEREAKQPLPAYPLTVGIVTSPSTAALQDVLNVLRRRNPMVRAVLSPAPVQGDAAPPKIVQALERLAELHAQQPLDAIMVVRGGGSIEDLWCFNDEHLARSVAKVAASIPVVTGVGHEIDFTLVDFTASERAPTPSAAAELVTPVTNDDHRAQLQVAASRLQNAFQMQVTEQRQQLTWMTGRLERLSPQGTIDNARQRLDMLLDRAARAAANTLAMKRAHLDRQKATLQGVSPQATLRRGYAIVYGPGGEVMTRAAQTNPGDDLTIRLSDGSISATVSDTDSQPEGKP